MATLNYSIDQTGNITPTDVQQASPGDTVIFTGESGTTYTIYILVQGTTNLSEDLFDTKFVTFEHKISILILETDTSNTFRLTTSNPDSSPKKSRGEWDITNGCINVNVSDEDHDDQGEDDQS